MFDIIIIIRSRRGSSQRFIVNGPATRQPPDFKLFLANEDNKVQFCELILRVWGSKTAFSRLDKCGLAVAVVDGKAYHLQTSNDEVSIFQQVGSSGVDIRKKNILT